MNSRSTILILQLILASFIASGQIIIVPVNRTVLCCSALPILPGYADSIDIDGDYTFEIHISARYLLDAIGYLALGYNDTELNRALPFGSAYPENKWHIYGEAMPSCPIGNEWGDWWLPNTGIKYLGFRKINGIADTTFGWIKLDFRGELVGPLDTLFIFEFGYSSLPNVHLTAGQSVVAFVDESKINDKFIYYPNPVLSSLFLENRFLSGLNVTLLDLTGRSIYTAQINAGTKAELDLTFLQSGLYILNVNSGKWSLLYKMLKI